MYASNCMEILTPVEWIECAFLLKITHVYIIYELLQVHRLNSAECKVLQRFNDDWFIVFTPQTLGELEYIHIWHDSFGSSPKWFCKRVEVICVRNNKKWNFNVERWFSILPTVENTECIISVGSPPNWKTDAIDAVEFTIRDEYRWASIFIRYVFE